MRIFLLFNSIEERERERSEVFLKSQIGHGIHEGLKRERERERERNGRECKKFNKLVAKVENRIEKKNFYSYVNHEFFFTL